MKTLILAFLTTNLFLAHAPAAIVYQNYGGYTFLVDGGTYEVSFQLLYNTPLNQNQGSEFLFKVQPTQLSFQRFLSQAPTSDVLSVADVAFKLAIDAPVGPTEPWSSAGQLTNPQWVPDGSIGYLGARANPTADSSQYYYGWVRVSYNSDHSMTLYDWAYESTPNTPIPAGFGAPEPSSVLLFLCSALTLGFRRRGRAPSAQNA